MDTEEALHDYGEICVRLINGQSEEEDEYFMPLLRKSLLADSHVKHLLPDFVRTSRTSEQLNQHLYTNGGSSWAQRRDYVWKALEPAVRAAEGDADHPLEPLVLASLDEHIIDDYWRKSLLRCDPDPDGAITAAKNMVEATLKKVLDEEGVAYTKKDDLPNLYGKVCAVLELSPSGYAEEPYKRILGGVVTTVNGLANLRNEFGDAHGRGKSSAPKPLPRHARLAVGEAGTLSMFIAETWNAKKTREVTVSRTSK